MWVVGTVWTGRLHRSGRDADIGSRTLRTQWGSGWTGKVKWRRGPAPPPARGGLPRLRPTTTRMTDERSRTSNERTNWKRGLIWVAWASFLVYGFVLAPGSTEGTVSLIVTLVNDPLNTHQDTSSIYAAVFSLLGVVPTVFAVLLLTQEREQRAEAPTRSARPLPAWPFVVASMAAGFAALGPYLALRPPYLSGNTADSATASVTPAYPLWLRVLQSKPFAVSLLLFSLLLYAEACGLLRPDQWHTLRIAFEQDWHRFTDLFWSERLVSTSCVDLLLLSVFVADPIAQDMRRRRLAPAAWRDWAWSDYAWLISILLLPGLGPSLYLVSRPPHRLGSER
ncbi:hypothetical protein CDCA_CDCA06G1991 [Cyanidium caldarium]|uniref:DUF2834 domain-containing protein n=1 Tax=Cyanidium caldarium TaxID=2771 RepID=A0AAV9IV49_CYACA|nr:hypothetical protein CDCA_CDCA06G1991 [Cyanidium caldarium]